VTTSYILEKQAEFKNLKILERQAEKTAMEKAMADAVVRKKASDYRIAVKMAKIEGRAAPAAPEPEVVPVPKVEAEVGAPMVQAAPAKKPAPKKKAASKKSSKRGS